MDIEVIGEIKNTEIIAAGSGVRELANLRKLFGSGRWRKMKGSANVKLPGGNIRFVELHWYEAHGIGRRKLKIKRFLD